MSPTTRARARLRMGAWAVAALAVAAPAQGQDFTYHEPGDLAPASGEGLAEYQVFVPGMRFPIESGPAFANSQVYSPGGYLGPPGGQCDAVNFSYPWRDNYCETRSWDMPLCPAGQGHQGQDIRAASCEPDVHWAVAAVDGTITQVGSYTVYLTAADGTRHDYLHMSNVQVSVGQDVERGDRLGYVSNEFGGTPTTVHLHYNIRQFVDGVGTVYVSPYMSLVASYMDLVGGGSDLCETLDPDGGILEETSLCFRRYGNPQYWREEAEAGHAGGLIWTNAFESDAPSNWGRWTIEPGADGRYELSVYVDPAWGVHAQTRYDVAHAGGVDEQLVDQSSADGWVSLGTFELHAGAQHYVSVYDDVAGPVEPDQHIAVDALRVSRLPDGGVGGGTGTGAGGSGGDPTPPVTVALPAAEADASCAVSPTGGRRAPSTGLLALAAAGVMLGLRRRRRSNDATSRS